jgi:hypothetical protein
MMWKRWGTCSLLLAGVIVCISPSTTAQSEPNSAPAATPRRVSAALTPTGHKGSPYRQSALTTKATDFYQLNWGVDSLRVKAVESGLMIRFSYRVVDVEKAKALADKKSTPFLLDEKTHVKLVVPSLEMVGQLRNSTTPEVGKSYWMLFSNKGNFVKPGNRVSVVIGKFRIDGLAVQ